MTNIIQKIRIIIYKILRKFFGVNIVSIIMRFYYGEGKISRYEMVDGVIEKILSDNKK